MGTQASLKADKFYDAIAAIPQLSSPEWARLLSNYFNNAEKKDFAEWLAIQSGVGFEWEDEDEEEEEEEEKEEDE